MKTHICSCAPLCTYSLVEPILEKFKFDFNSDEPLDEQELEGCKRLRKYFLECVEAVKEEREARVEAAREAYQAQLEEEEELRIQVRNSSSFAPSFSKHCSISLIILFDLHISNRRRNA